jgi:hypothetical protein
MDGIYTSFVLNALQTHKASLTTLCTNSRSKIRLSQETGSCDLQLNFTRLESFYISDLDLHELDFDYPAWPNKILARILPPSVKLLAVLDGRMPIPRLVPYFIGLDAVLEEGLTAFPNLQEVAVHGTSHPDIAPFCDS